MIMRLRTLFAVIAMFCLVPGAAQALEVQELTTSSGITVWLVENHNNPIISLEFAFTGGSAHDPADKQGLANLVSATLDEGAGARDSQTVRQTLTNETIKMSFSANRERLSGSFRTLTDSADLAFELLEDAINQPRFDMEPVERIKRQIAASIKSEENDPGTATSRLFRELMYGDHPFNTESNGTLETLESISPDDLRTWTAQHLSTDGLIVSAVGDITADELLVRVEQVFGSLPQTSNTQEIAPVSNLNPGVTSLIEVDQPQTSVLMFQDGITREDPDFYAAYVNNHILGGSQFDSRLHNELREKRGLTYGVGSSIGGSKKDPLVYVSFQSANATATQAKQLAIEEWQRFASDGPTQQEMDAAIDYITGSYALQLTSSAGIASVLLGLQIAELPASYPDDRTAIFEALTLDDLKRVAARVYNADALTIIATGNPDGWED